MLRQLRRAVATGFGAQGPDALDCSFLLAPKGLDRIVAASGLTVVERHPGNWKEAPGLYFQDVVILEKP